MRSERSFFQDNTAQPPFVIFQQFGRTKIARNQDRVVFQPKLRCGAHLPRNYTKQPVRKILQVMHSVGEQRIVDLAHPHPCALLHALNCRFRGQATVDRLIDPPAPTLVICEHLVGRDDLLMFTASSKIDLARHPVDLRAHFIEGGVNALPLCLGIFSDGMFDAHIRLMKNCYSSSGTFD